MAETERKTVLLRLTYNRAWDVNREGCDPDQWIAEVVKDLDTETEIATAADAAAVLGLPERTLDAAEFAVRHHQTPMGWFAVAENLREAKEAIRSSAPATLARFTEEERADIRAALAEIDEHRHSAGKAGCGPGYRRLDPATEKRLRRLAEAGEGE